MTNRRQQTWSQRIQQHLFMLLVINLLAGTTLAQRDVIDRVRQAQGERQALIRVLANEAGAGLGLRGRSENEDSLDSASVVGLNTNARLEETLKTAERYREDGNFRVATQLWQAVLEQSGDALSSSDGVKYYSLVDEVERILGSLPEDGLQTYRITSDANAREVMAQSKELSRNTALNQVVQRYFLSSLGDDAAFELGCSYLDQFDFIGARRMFEKILKRYPDPSVSLSQIYVRIALCHAFLGEPQLAEAMLDLATEDGGDDVYAQVRLVRQSLGNLNPQALSVTNSSWVCRLGNEKRYGVMPSPPDRAMKSPLAAVWQFYFEPQRKNFRKFEEFKGNTLVGEDSYSDSAESSLNAEERKLISSWKTKNWRPAGHLLFDSGVMYYKSCVDFIAWDTEAISTSIRNGPEVDTPTIRWRSMWRNTFIMDDASRMMQAIRQNFGNYGRRKGAVFDTSRPSQEHEVFLFGDEVFQQSSIYDGKLYSIEGRRFDTNGSSIGKSVPAQWNTAVRRTRSNFLSAYDAKSGKTLWTLPRVPSETDPGMEEPPWLANGGFMSAPIGFDKLILAPVNQGGSISIYAFDPADQGKTVWKAFLCDEPENGARPWPAINLSIDGSDLFVSCGTGVIFILDPSTGTVRFARRYERKGRADKTFRQLNWSNVRTIFSGWSNDVVIPYGRQMICFCSDTNQVTSYDRNTGDVVWAGPNNPKEYEVNYLLGIYDGVLYAAGTETVIAIDLDGEGRMLWGGSQVFDGKMSRGRGILTAKGIFVPVENSIFHFDLVGKNSQAVKLDSVEVELGTKAPVGNLYSDGTRFWVHGGNRVYALANVSQKKKKDDK